MTKKEKIMHSAIRLFCSLGFQNTSTTKITKDAGVGTGTLFLYFKSKDELVNALYRDIKNEMSGYYSVFEDSDLTFKEQLQTLWFELVRWGIDHPLKFKFLMQFKNSPYISQFTKEQVNEEHQQVEDVMKQAMTNGEIIDQPFEFLISLFTAQFSSIIQYLTEHSPESEDLLIQTSFDVLWNGIKRV